MSLVGKKYDVKLKEAHLQWGKKSNTGKKRNRDRYEVYFPIHSPSKIGFGVERKEVFQLVYKDEYICDLRASGTQSKKFPTYAKNFESNKDLKVLGRFVKDKLGLKPDDEIEFEWISDDTIVMKVK